ncbi:YifB family Mg chelatase-like AAA ATPase [Nesterenkonia flava]|uniref:YifB family Mg chelatase-like AAA ATPase n=1 Tax=Nesterenkonia flava TaxID=469799 RepID=A0ABU1FU55_9MICC|nr:YifB family Mg chelatase-like AAA ATPase [Nesterenkonia flava]MDR5711708.1 YifB family Mg chelatase-like AAA ATPase [Nesterenkonia flava]
MGRTRGVVLIGMQGHVIEVEADVGQSLPSFILLGLPDAALRESQDRIRSAAKNAGLDLPARRLTVNLFPASLRKSGSGLDLAILMSAWAADGRVTGTDGIVFLAELGLDGRLRPVRGVLPAVASAAADGVSTVVVAKENATEAALVPDLQVLAADHVIELAALFRAPGAHDIPEAAAHQVERYEGGVPQDGTPEGVGVGPDLQEVRGQHEARFALEMAAAGAHHLLLMGAPGAGKTMLAERLPSILPPLQTDQAMEVTAIESISAGARSVRTLRRRPPFEAPHHSASAAAIVGGGARVPSPGAATRAHHGVLFLDEAPEFHRQVLDSLRQPMETGRISLHRAAGVVTYPAQFQLVMAANPCPCGLNVGRGTGCTCTVAQRRSYLTRISGPLMDRIDLQVHVERPSSAALALSESAESSATVLERVVRAREAQRERLSRYGLQRNSQVPVSLFFGALKISPGTTAQLDSALDHALLSLRGYVRVLRLAWTLSDLAGSAQPGADDIDAAMQLRLQTGRS